MFMVGIYLQVCSISSFLIYKSSIEKFYFIPYFLKLFTSGRREARSQAQVMLFNSCYIITRNHFIITLTVS